jgi:hypothetical protein
MATTPALNTTIPPLNKTTPPLNKMTPFELPEAFRIAEAVFLSCCVALCLAGNTLILLSLKRHPTLRTPANVILGSLAFSDLLMAIPMFIMIHTLAARNFTGVHMDIQAGISTTLVATASLHIGLISLDRFISIRYALRYVSLVTMSRIAKLLALIWGVAVSLVGMVLLLTATLAPNSDAKWILFYRRPPITEHHNTHDFHPLVIVYKTLVFVLFFFLPFTTMVTSYVYVSKVVYNKRRSIRSELPAIAPVTNAKCTKTIFIVMTLYTILNIPYSVVSVIQILDEHLKLSYCPRVFLAIASLASCCNPYIYAYRDRHFKQAFKKIVTCK